MTSIERKEARFRRRQAKRENKRRNLLAEYGTFESAFTYDHLYRSYKKCCIGVGWKASTQKYRVNSFYNVANTYIELHAGKYKSRGFNEFDIRERGKPRHIKSVHISERVVQRCLCDYSLIPVLSRSFIYDNGACMKDRGIDFALNRTTTHLRRYYREHGNDGYVLTFDFSKFFDKINHERLKEIINDCYEDVKIKRLINYFIDAFGAEGLGLGSQISQISALAYPNKLDHYIKEVLGIKYYGRYMDDAYLIHESKEYLHVCLNHIEAMCCKYGIVLNRKKTQIIRLSRGFVFLKTHFYLLASGKILRKPARKGITTMRRKLRTFHEWVENGKMQIEDVRTSFVSWKGHLKRRNAHKTVFKTTQLYNKLFKEAV